MKPCHFYFASPSIGGDLLVASPRSALPMNALDIDAVVDERCTNAALMIGRAKEWVAAERDTVEC